MSHQESGLVSVGDFEYQEARKFLLRVTSPNQLHTIEQNSPQILGEDVELWKTFIARDIPDWKRKNYAPKNPKKWREVYLRYLKEQKEEIERDKEKLRESMMGLQKQKESRISRVISATQLPKLPRDPRMRANNGGVPIGRKRGFDATGPKPRSTTSQGVLSKVRKEARELSARNKVAAPIHQLDNKTSQVLKAPAAMVDQYRRTPASGVRKSTPNQTSNQQSLLSQEERERRLLALKKSGQKRGSAGEPKPTLIGSDDELDGKDDELDDLFYEKLPVKQSVSPRRPILDPVSRFRRPTPQIRLEKISRSSPTAQQPQSPTSTPSTPFSPMKPSEVIMGLLYKDKCKISKQAQPPLPSSPSPPRETSPARSKSHSPPQISPPRPLVPMRKKPEVDIFNRRGTASKRPRMR